MTSQTNIQVETDSFYLYDDDPHDESYDDPYDYIDDQINKSPRVIKMRSVHDNIIQEIILSPSEIPAIVTKNLSQVTTGELWELFRSISCSWTRYEEYGNLTDLAMDYREVKATPEEIHKGLIRLIINQYTADVGYQNSKFEQYNHRRHGTPLPPPEFVNKSSYDICWKYHQ
jgi:hypothetical protein